MNDSRIIYIEKDIFKTIGIEEIMQRFQNIKTRGGLLNKLMLDVIKINCKLHLYDLNNN
jgi:hypothetical protein